MTPIVQISGPNKWGDVIVLLSNGDMWYYGATPGWRKLPPIPGLDKLLPTS